MIIRRMTYAHKKAHTCTYIHTYAYIYIYIYIYYIYIYIYCKVRNIGVELLLATLASGSDSLILRSVYICSIFQRFFIFHRPPGAFMCLEAMCTSNLPWRRYRLPVTCYTTSISATNHIITLHVFCIPFCFIVRDIMVHTLILRFANMEKWINYQNLSTPIFRTLQYIYIYMYVCVCLYIYV